MDCKSPEARILERSNMFPVPALAGLGSRLAVYLTQVARTNPRLITTLASRLRTGGAAIGSSIESIVEYVKKSPVNATLVFGTLASLGVSLVDAVSSPDDAPAVTEHLTNLQSAASSNTSFSAYAAIADESVSPTLKVNVDDVMALQAQSRPAINWARGQFGSGRAAADALDALEFLMAMPSETRRFLLTETR